LGPYTGYYVDVRTLSALQRPELDTSYAGEMYVEFATIAFDEPSPNSTPVRPLVTGTLVRAFGLEANGYAEISIAGSERLYVDAAALGNREELPTASESSFPAAPPNVERPSDVGQGTPPVPLGISLDGLVRPDDYPARAVRDHEEGKVAFRLEINSFGLITQCIIEQSSGSRSLDEAACRVMSSRAEFHPARDGMGNPIDGVYRSSIVWSLR
jgi:TonB family protein